MIRSKTMMEWLDSLQLERGFGPAARRNYEGTIRRLGRFCGRTLTVADWCCDDCNRYLAHLFDCGRSPQYVASVRAHLHALCTGLRDAGLLERVRLRPVRRPQPVIDCWDRHEVAALVLAAGRLHVDYRGLPRSWYWQTLIRAAWHTGLRRTDLLGLRRECISPHGSATIQQHKTGRLVAVGMPASLVEQIDSRGPLGIIWPWPYSYEHFRREFGRIVAAAGIRPGPWKWLRRASGNAAEQLAPGLGHLHLGNERRTFERSYLRRQSLPLVRLRSV